MKVGDYVRTKKGTIVKIIDKKFDDTLLIDLYKTDKNYYLMKIDMVKSSPNIIDLIEVGDYVNGHRVIDFMLENGKIKGIIVDADIWGFDIDEIKSIVTHEQFSVMEYKVGDDKE